MSSDELISKKDLLYLTGISYGQLYRWKRKNLIPEEWFIKKSSFTGQETFFPKEKVLTRIKKIQSMKDDTSLDELAEVFSPNFSDINLTLNELIGRNIISENITNVYIQIHQDKSVFSFNDILFMTVIEKFLASGDISIDESKLIGKTLEDAYDKLQSKNPKIIFIRKMGVGSCFILSDPSELYTDNSTKLVFTANLLDCIEQVKLKLKE